MKSLKIKIGELFEKLNCLNIPYEEIQNIEDKSIYIKTPTGDLTLILGLMRKKSPKVKLTFDNGNFLTCAEKHILYDTNYNEVYAKDAECIISIYGKLKVINKEFLDESDVYDISVEHPHMYITSNGIIHHNTMISTAFACDQITKGNYDKLIITRNAIGCGKSIGFFPGTAKEKCEIWLSHIISYCKEFLGSGTTDVWLNGSHPKIILEPLEVVRGRSYEHAIILVEEAQQLSVDEIKCLSTRIGEGSLMILTGDPKQKDIKEDGLEKFCKLVEKYEINGVGVVRFTPDDILRHDIVRELILAFEKEGL